MNIKAGKLFKILLLMNILIQVEGKCMESEEDVRGHELSIKICKEEEYKKEAESYVTLDQLRNIDFKVFDRRKEDKLNALKSSIYLKTGDSLFIESKKGEDENFIFSNDLVDCVGLVISEDTKEGNKRLYVAHLSRSTAEKELEKFFSLKKFSVECSKVSITTSVQSDVLRLTYDKLRQANFLNISKSYGPFIRRNNTMYIPLYMFRLTERDPVRLQTETENVVARWMSRALIVSTETGSLFRLNPERPDLDSKEVLTLKDIKD